MNFMLPTWRLLALLKAIPAFAWHGAGVQALAGSQWAPVSTAAPITVRTIHPNTFRKCRNPVRSAVLATELRCRRQRDLGYRAHQARSVEYSALDVVTASCDNLPLTASAGVNQIVLVGRTATLDGSGNLIYLFSLMP
jgi:hypothetical protein